MRNFVETRSPADQPFSILYPSHEQAVTIASDGGFPITDILVGITYPFHGYKVNRAASLKYFLFEHVLESKGAILIDGKWHAIEAGDTYIIHRADTQNLHADKAQPFKKIWFSFASEYLEKMLDGYGIGTGVYRADTRTFFQSVFDVANLNVAPRHKLFTVAENVHAIITAVAAASGGAERAPVSAIKNELLSAVYTRCSLDEIAKRLFMSKSNLIRVFKKHASVTPYRFLIDEKLKAAKTLLRSTTMSVKAVSDSLYFTDEHYFSYLFKQKTGVSPSEYRAGKE